MNLKKEFTRPQCERFLRECNFTEQEHQIFALIMQEKSPTEIALSMNISRSTYDRRLKNIKRKILTII